MEIEKLNKVLLLLGSNVGDRLKYISTALLKISDQIGIITKQSSFWKTDAWGDTNQEYYINCAAAIQTKLSATKILKKINSIETEMGRVRKQKWEARIIDIDILFNNNYKIKTPDLEIPHPQFQNRKFAIMPVQEIEPELWHPGLQIKIDDILAACTDKGHVSIYNT